MFTSLNGSQQSLQKIPGPASHLTPIHLFLLVIQIAWITAFSLMTNQQALIGGTVVFIIAILSFWDPRVIVHAAVLTAVLFPAPVVSEEFILSFWGINIYAMDWILIISSTILLAQFAKGSLEPLPRSRLSILLLLFLVVVIIGAINGIQQGNHTKDALADLRLFFYYVSFFLVLFFIRSFKDLEAVFFTAVVAGSIGAIPEIYGSLTSNFVDRVTGLRFGFGRITGAHEGVYPVLLVSCLAIFPFVGSNLKRLTLTLSIVVFTIAMFLSYTRGSWVAALGGIIVLGIFTLLYSPSRKQIIKTALVGLVSGGILLWFLDIFGIFSVDALLSRATLVSSKQIDISSLARLTEWSFALSKYLEKPLMGLGLGYVFKFYVIGVGDVEQTFLHNSYLYVLTKLGAFGLSSFLALFLTAVGVFARTLSKPMANNERGITFGFGMMLIVFLFKALTTWHLNVINMSLFVGVILGSIVVASNEALKPGNRY